MTPIQTARSLYHFARLTRDPSRLGEVFGFVETIQTPEILGPIRDAFAATPEGVRALRERPRIGPIDPAALGALPEGSLGRAFADHLVRNGLDPSTLPTRPAHDELSYVTAHLYETHDVWHAVTGFGADVAGELGLQAFYAAQMPARLAPVLLAVGFTNTFLYDFGANDARMDAIARGHLLGRHARSLLGVRWNELWETPLADVRARFGIDLTRLDALLDSGHHPSA